MADSTIFRAYGENSATFLIFQALALKPGAIADVLLANLKSFGDGHTVKWEGLESPELWLFPSFGKRCGFGEPDVLLLVGEHAFWIEVETTIDCKRRLPALQNSLLQMWRFRLFQDALTRPARTKFGGRRIVGTTINGHREERPAEIRLSGHGALQEIRTRLRKSGKVDNDHYVLFTVNKPKGEGREGQSYPEVLKSELDKLSRGYREKLSRLNAKKCWYAYWYGDLENKFNQAEGAKLLLAENYVRIKKS